MGFAEHFAAPEAAFGEDVRAHPHSGGLFAVQTDTQGLPSTTFAG
jgi:hypothetical protein